MPSSLKESTQEVAFFLPGRSWRWLDRLSAEPSVKSHGGQEQKNMRRLQTSEGQCLQQICRILASTRVDRTQGKRMNSRPSWDQASYVPRPVREKSLVGHICLAIYIGCWETLVWLFDGLMFDTATELECHCTSIPGALYVLQYFKFTVARGSNC